jgi:hypothetical protein
MMKSLIIAAIVLLVPAALLAVPTMGIYFTYEPGKIYYYPSYPAEQFDGYIYVHNTACYLTAAEFQVVIGGPQIVVSGFELLPGWISLGDPIAGISITGWPPLDGWNPGYNLLMKLHLLALDMCQEYDGTIVNMPIYIGPHPDTGAVRGSCWPDNTLFNYIGLTSIFCPWPVAAEEKSWGAIKAMLD